MADLMVVAQALGWGRGQDGRFVISVDVQVPTSDGKVVRVPHLRFLLSKEEEQGLLTSLTGLVVATQAPPKLVVGNGNGRH